MYSINPSADKMKKTFIVELDTDKTLDEAIKYLQDNPVKKTWEGSESYVATWQEQQNKTIEDLIKYKREHFQ